jgi:hypothetical protein
MTIKEAINDKHFFKQRSLCGNYSIGCVAHNLILFDMNSHPNMLVESLKSYIKASSSGVEVAPVWGYDYQTPLLHGIYFGVHTPANTMEFSPEQKVKALRSIEDKFIDRVNLLIDDALLWTERRRMSPEINFLMIPVA